MGMALFYGGIVEVLAGMWMFRVGNTFGALVFAGYGGFWLSLAALNIEAFGFLNGYTVDGVTDTEQLYNDLAVYLLGWGIYSLIMTIAAHRTSVVVILILFNVAGIFIMLAIHNFNQRENYNWQQASGVFGVIASFIGWYGAFAGLLTEKNSLFTLPVGDMDPIWRYYGWLPPLIETVK
jgi:succinate-acetate transporter protein